MPNIVVVLKDEITRLARKEAKQQVGPLKKIVSTQQRTIAALNGEVAELKRGQSFLKKQEKKRLGEKSKADAAKGVRFSPRWVAADRKRLGLHARDYASLVEYGA